MSTSPERMITIGGCSNFRDVGGYPTADGARRTRWRCLFRSDTPSKISAAADVERLRTQLRVAHTVDFRSVDEQRAQPYRFPGVTTHALSIDPGNLSEAKLRGAGFSEESMVAAMTGIYDQLVTAQQEEYAAFLRVLLQAGREGSAVLFHCTAGKDRTGYGAALLLALLGVDRATIDADYLLTNEHFVPPEATVAALRQAGAPEPAIDAVFFVRKPYLDHSFALIESRCGSVEAYAREELKLTQAEIEELRSLYLE